MRRRRVGSDLNTAARLASFGDTEMIVIQRLLAAFLNADQNGVIFSDAKRLERYIHWHNPSLSCGLALQPSLLQNHTIRGRNLDSKRRKLLRSVHVEL